MKADFLGALIADETGHPPFRPVSGVDLSESGELKPFLFRGKMDYK